MIDSRRQASVRSHLWAPMPAMEPAAQDQDSLLAGQLDQAIAELEKVIANSQRQLSNEAFIAKAPEKIVAGMRQKQAEYEGQLAKLRAVL